MLRKKIIGLFLLITFLFYQSCKKDIRNVEFDMPYQTSFIVPSTIGINLPVSLPTPDINTNSSQEFSNKGTRPDLIKTVKITYATLTITDPSGKTFSFLKSLHLFLSASGVQELEAAYLDNIPNSVGNTISLILKDENLAAFLKKDKIYLRSEVVTDETLLQDVTIKVDVKFHVTAQLL